MENFYQVMLTEHLAAGATALTSVSAFWDIQLTKWKLVTLKINENTFPFRFCMIDKYASQWSELVYVETV